jgi:hypothetical protein
VILKKSIVFTLVASLAASLVPAQAWASDDTVAPAATVVTRSAEPVPTLPAPATNIRASAQAALARLADESRDRQPGAATTMSGARRDRSNNDMQYQGGGGGSKMGLIMMLVGTAVGIGMAYYTVQLLKKQQNSAAGGDPSRR